MRFILRSKEKKKREKSGAVEMACYPDELSL